MKYINFVFLTLISSTLILSSCGDDDSSTPAPQQTEPDENPIVGKWTAYDVSPLLLGAGIDGITAEFKTDNSYVVVSTASGSSTTYEGTYVVSDDADSAGIYTIELNQSSPTTLTSEGIFAVYTASSDSMWYEVAQTSPSITGVTAPTLAGGFGSTSSGAFGETNIQKYNRD